MAMVLLGGNAKVVEDQRFDYSISTMFFVFIINIQYILLGIYVSYSIEMIKFNIILRFFMRSMQILRFKSCNDLTVSNLTITNSPKAHIRLNSCDNATFSDINIRAPGDSPNTDGFDIYTSKNILIQNSNIQCGKPCLYFILWLNMFLSLNFWLILELVHFEILN